MRPDDSALHAIFEAGIAAPSAENRHHVRFVLRPDSVTLRATRQEEWGNLPHRRWLALMACGAMLENMALRSAALGWGLVANVSPDAGHTARVAELTWVRLPESKADPLAAAISERHTNRRFYQRRPASPLALRSLEGAVRSIPGAALSWLDSRLLRQRALKAIRLAETERFRREALHRELYEDIRFDAGWHASVDSGIPPAALQIEFGAQWAFQQLRRWRLMRPLAGVGVATMLGLRAGYLPCALAPHIGLLTGKSAHTAAHVIDAGRAFQRAWLSATSWGLAIQPMAAATVLCAQHPGNGWVAEDARRNLMHFVEALAPTPEAVPYMLFRMGHAPPPDVVASRPPVETFVAL